MDDDTIPDVGFDEMRTVVYRAPPAARPSDVITTCRVSRRRGLDHRIVVVICAALILVGAGIYIAGAVLAAGTEPPLEREYRWPPVVATASPRSPAAPDPAPESPPEPAMASESQVVPEVEPPPSQVVPEVEPPPSQVVPEVEPPPSQEVPEEPPPSQVVGIVPVARPVRARRGKLKILCPEPFLPVIDGRERRTTRPVTLRAGRHRISVRYPGRNGASEVRTVHIRPDRTTVVFFLGGMS